MTTTSAASALTSDERAALEADPWFAGLSPALREEVLSRGQLRRVRHGGLVAARGQPAQEWLGIARGALRLGSVSLAGRQIIHAYSRPGTWLGDTALVDGEPNPHDVNAQGEAVIVALRRQDFRDLLASHAELPVALLQLQCRRVRMLVDQVEAFATLPLAARLARQLLVLVRDFGVAAESGTRIALPLAQEDLAQLLGASRQRVNRELKQFEREGALRVESAGVVVLDGARLQASVNAPGG